MRVLLVSTAILESTAGLALMAAPSAVATALLGVALQSTAAIAVARIAGAALLALSVACWLARNAAGSRAARGLIAGMLCYNCGTVAVLVHAAMWEKVAGVGLWPGVILHISLATWCIACLRPTPHAPQR